MSTQRLWEGTTCQITAHGREVIETAVRRFKDGDTIDQIANGYGISVESLKFLMMIEATEDIR